MTPTLIAWEAACGLALLIVADVVADRYGTTAALCLTYAGGVLIGVWLGRLML